MKRLILPGIILGIAALVVILFTRGIQKTITLEINGVSKEVSSSSWTVAGFLEEQGIVLTVEDAIEPQLSSLLMGDKKIAIHQAAWFTIENNGAVQSFFGRYNTLEELFDAQAIDITPGAALYLDGESISETARIELGSNHSLQIIDQAPVIVTHENSSQTFNTAGPTLGAGLWSNNLYLNAGDEITMPLDSPIHGPIDTGINTSQDITLQLTNRSMKSKTSASTVGEALSDIGIALQGLDYSQPGANAPIPKDGNIRVIRVREEQYLESEPIPFETETQPVADLEIDKRSLVQSGVYGLNTKRIRVRLEDDTEVSRQVEDEYVSQPPQPEIIGYGTNIVPRTLDTPGGPIKYWRALEMYAVSYNVTSNGGYGTATGIPLAKGVAAIDPRYIPYGTRMYVPGYGEALAADTGGGIKGRMIDLGYLDEDYVSWHQWVTVYFLWPPPENVVWIIP